MAGASVIAGVSVIAGASVAGASVIAGADVAAGAGVGVDAQEVTTMVNTIDKVSSPQILCLNIFFSFLLQNR
jgi:hypothetical protein